MKKETITKYINKRVRILLKNNNTYTLLIDSVTDSDFSGIDKFNNHLTISNDDIIVIELAGGNNDGR